MRLSRAEYVGRYGPTTGDRLRLADTDLWIRIEADHLGYGDEPIWGYAKNLRSRQAQDDAATPASQLDALLAGVVVVDPLLGVVKTNLGIKDGRIVGIGRAGSPAISDAVDLVVGPHTVPINAYGLLATAGGVDSHVHLITPRLVPVALAAGITTCITAGFEEPPAMMERTYLAFEGLPVNLGLQASARTDARAPLEALIEAGACGLKVHEDWGAYPEVIDAALTVADAHDIAVCLHTDGLNESGELPETLAAIAGRAVHAYHVEGAGGGHIPDLIGIAGEPNVVCSSTTPTLPWGPATAAEHAAMIVLVHGGSLDSPEDVAAARERVHRGSLEAEGPLHELGAIAIINSDAQGMGRIGETIRRTWQLADAMKRWRGTASGAGWPPSRPLPGTAGRPPAAAGSGGDDNARVLHYLAKYTVNPARAQGIADEVGSLAPGRLADIVLWRPSHFGVRPELVLKAGHPTWAASGEGNATVEGAEPRRFGPHWGAVGHAPASLATTFVSAAALAAGLPERLASRRRFVAVAGTRVRTRPDLVDGQVPLRIPVDPVDGTVRVDGRRLRSQPVAAVPLSRRYLLL